MTTVQFVAQFRKGWLILKVTRYPWGFFSWSSKPWQIVNVVLGCNHHKPFMFAKLLICLLSDPHSLLHARMGNCICRQGRKRLTAINMPRHEDIIIAIINWFPHFYSYLEGSILSRIIWKPWHYGSTVFQNAPCSESETMALWEYCFS